MYEFMKISQIFFCTILIFALAQFCVLASAMEITGIEIELLENGVVSVKENINCETPGRIKIIIPGTIETPGVYTTDGKSVSHNLTTNSDSEQITFYLPKNRNVSTGVTLKYKTNFFTEKKGDAWQLSFSLPTTPNLTSIKIIFPKNLKISFTTKTPSWIYVSENYQAIELKATTGEINFACNYKFIEVKNKSANTTIGDNSDNNSNDNPDDNPGNGTGFFNQDASGFIFPFIVVLISISIIFIVLKTKTGKSKESTGSTNLTKNSDNGTKESILNILDENEKKIVKLLKHCIEEGREKVTQAYIQKTTGIPKSSLSRKISTLERRNIIECERDGRINRIKLKNWVFEK